MHVGPITHVVNVDRMFYSIVEFTVHSFKTPLSISVLTTSLDISRRQRLMGEVQKLEAQ